MKSFEGQAIRDLLSKHGEKWAGNLESLGLLGLRSYRIPCPCCNESGIPFPKWKKGNKNQPLYITHRNGNSLKRICEIPYHESNGLNRSVRISDHDLFRLLQYDNIFVLFSGGKDSLCLLHYLDTLTKSIEKRVTALHANTTAGFPEVEKYVQDVCHQLNIPLIIVFPHHDYFDLAKKWGIPGVKSRWCCKTLKIAPISRYLSQIEGKKVVFDGIRAAESNVRATYLPIWYHPSFKCLSISPLFYWSDAKIQKYIQSKALPISPVAELNTSAECWCGAYKSRKDFESLLSIHPEIFDKLIEVEAAQKGKYTFLYEQGERIPLCSLKKRK